MSNKSKPLRELLMPSGTPDFRRFLVIASVILTFIALSWAASRMPGCRREPVITHLLLPVAFSNVPENMVLTYYHTDKIDIRVQADPRDIEQLNRKSIQYPADLYTDLEFDPAGASGSVDAGHYVLPVDQNRIPLEPSIKILDITPPYLSVRLEDKISKSVPVSVPLVGEPAQGRIFLEAAPEPAQVTLTGAQSAVEAIEVVRTKPVDLSQAGETFKREIPLDIEAPDLYTASHSIIVVTVPIQEKMVTKTLENIPIRLVNATGKARLEPERITIDIRGPYETLGNPDILSQIYAFVDLAGVSPGVYARHAYINIPVGLMMTEAQPRVFTVKIE